MNANNSHTPNNFPAHNTNEPDTNLPNPHKPKTILVVDDSTVNLSLVAEILQDSYEVRAANTGRKALRIVNSSPPPDLILLDIMMPEMNGYEVCRRIKSSPATSDIPIIFLTAMCEPEEESMGFELGAADYITKPINPSTLLARVHSQLQVKSFADHLKNQNQYLESEMLKRTAELTAIQDVTIQVIASLAETRDTDTGFHIRRTQHYVLALAKRLQQHPRFQKQLTQPQLATLFKSAPLHDVGKVGIPDRILLKPGRLTPDEFEIMKTHSALGSDAIEQAERQLGFHVSFLDCAKTIARHHHEKWNGMGYPDGLAGDAIPLAARIMAVADVYDALISIRVYKKGVTHEEALKIMKEDKGKGFDPDIIDAFLANAEEFRQIATRYADKSATDIAASAVSLAS